MDISKIISDFRSWSGSNYRIEKNDPREKAKYKELKKADVDKDEKISLPEYLSYLQATQQLYIDQELSHGVQSIDALRNNEEKMQRWMAITDLRRLGLLGYQSAISVLAEAMKDDKEWDLRKMAANALRVVGDGTVVPALIETLKTDVNSAVRSAAADALAQIQKTLKPNDPTYQEIELALKPANKH